VVPFFLTDGGQLILGVDNNRNLIGVDDADRVTRDIDNIAANNCEPSITVIQEVLFPKKRAVRSKSSAAKAGQEKPVIVVNIPKGDMRPFRTNRGLFYIRTTSGRRQASREELLRLFQATESLHYDETPLLRQSLADLDLSAVDDYLQATGQAELKDTREQVLDSWGMLAKGHPTIAGMIFFGRKPQQHLPFAQINAARFMGTDSSTDPFDRKDFTGRLLEVIDQAERFLYLHLRIPHEIRGFAPEPKPELPKEALREAIVNAVAHRDYTIHGPIRLFVFDNRIEIHTPGKPPNTVDEAAMRAGVHVVRNPRLYARLSDAGLVTRAGTGIRRIIRLVREATGREVEIAIREFEVLLTIPRK
jgi:ATP-dependent DNA helicase RecG